MPDVVQPILWFIAGIVIALCGAWYLYEIGLHISVWGAVAAAVCCLGLWLALSAGRDIFFPKEATVIGKEKYPSW